MTIDFIQNMGGGGFLFFILFGLAYFLIWVYCLLDVIRSDFRDQNMKLIWVIILLFAHGLGPIAYLILGKNTKTT